MPHAETKPIIPAETLSFLAALAQNNTAAWFAEHKPTFEADVQEPLRRLAASLGPNMLTIDPGLEVSPGSVVSRIRRDVRFSRDKSPFRTTLWLAFKRRGKEWTSRPAFFMEIGPEAFRHGMGFYSAGTRGMAVLRQLAQEQPDGYARAMECAQAAGYVLWGDVYKRPRIPLDQPPCVQELYRRRNVYMLCTGEPGEAIGNPGLTGQLATGFAALGPLYGFWLEAVVRANVDLEQ